MKKYERVMAWVKDNIESGLLSPGDKLPSEPELMQRFSVSRNSVRQAINELAKEKLVESRHGIGTFCLRRGQGKSMLIGLVCLRITSYIFPRIIQGCNRVVQKNGYSLLMNESWYDLAHERTILAGLRDKGVDGIIITPVEGEEGENNAALIKEIEGQGTAVVLLDNEFPDYNLSSVVIDDLQAGRAAAKLLWDMGHRQIGVLYSTNYRPKILRKRGVLEFLGERQVSPPNQWVVGIEGQISPFRTYGQIRDFFRGNDALPTAIVCSSDDEALMFIRQAQRKGLRIPDDISVVSFDNSDLSRFSHPRLTTMDHPSEYMGELAATLLLDRIHHPEMSVQSRNVIRSAPVNRDSVRRVPAGEEDVVRETH